MDWLPQISACALKQDEGTGLWVNDDGTPAMLLRPEVLAKLSKEENSPDLPEADEWWQG